MNLFSPTLTDTDALAPILAATKSAIAAYQQAGEKLAGEAEKKFCDRHRQERQRLASRLAASGAEAVTEAPSPESGSAVSLWESVKQFFSGDTVRPLLQTCLNADQTLLTEVKNALLPGGPFVEPGLQQRLAAEQASLAEHIDRLAQALALRKTALDPQIV